MSILASLLLNIFHFGIFGTSESSTFSSICEFIGQVLITHVQKGNVFNKKERLYLYFICIMYIYNVTDNSIACEWTEHWEWHQKKAIEVNSLLLISEICAMVHKDNKCRCVFRSGIFVSCTTRDDSAIWPWSWEVQLYLGSLCSQIRWNQIKPQLTCYIVFQLRTLW